MILEARCFRFLDYARNLNLWQLSFFDFARNDKIDVVRNENNYCTNRYPDINFKYEIFVDQSNGELEKVDEQKLNLELLCSYDPNDKLVTSTDNTGNIRVNTEDRLFYTIRFQNTGNYLCQGCQT